ncbi:MAG: hypothetical protein WCQ77_13010, partial [Planctomycetota bacterium]
VARMRRKAPVGGGRPRKNGQDGHVFRKEDKLENLSHERQKTASQGCDEKHQSAEAGQEKMARMAMFFVKRTS